MENEKKELAEFEEENEFTVKDELRAKRKEIKSFDELVDFIKYVEENCNTGYGTAPRAMAQAALAVSWYLCDKFGITGYQAGFVGNKCGLKIVDYDDMLYPQYDDKYENTIFYPKNSKRFCGDVCGIKNVIFNDPATIVIWSDDTKTVVKCQEGETYDPEKGLVMAIVKRAYGNKGNYCNELKKWLPKEKPDIQLELKCSDWKTDALSEATKKIQKAVYKCFSSSTEALAYKGKREAVQKAYDILVTARDGTNDNPVDFDEIIGYLGEALED